MIPGPILRLDWGKITSDIEDFRAALTEKEWDRAAQLYDGPFLAGFYLNYAPDFERWVEEERSAVSHDALRAIEAAARGATAAGRTDAATEYWRRLTRLDQVNSRFAIGYIEALTQAGDRAAQSRMRRHMPRQCAASSR